MSERNRLIEKVLELQRENAYLNSQKAELIEFVKDIVEYDYETVLYNREKLLQKHGVS